MMSKKASHLGQQCDWNLICGYWNRHRHWNHERSPVQLFGHCSWETVLKTVYRDQQHIINLEKLSSSHMSTTEWVEDSSWKLSTHGQYKSQSQSHSHWDARRRKKKKKKYKPPPEHIDECSESFITSMKLESPLWTNTSSDILTESECLHTCEGNLQFWE